MKRDLTEELVQAMAYVNVADVHKALGDDANKVKSDFEAEGRDFDVLMLEGQGAVMKAFAE